MFLKRLFNAQCEKNPIDAEKFNLLCITVKLTPVVNIILELQLLFKNYNGGDQARSDITVTSKVYWVGFPDKPN